MILATTPIELNDAPKLGKTTLLGEWCKIYGDDQLIHHKLETLPYHWHDSCQAYRDSEMIERVVTGLINELAPVLNKVHDLKFSKHSWRILLGFWLTQFTTIIYDRWAQLGLALDQLGAFECLYDQKIPVDLTPNDTQDFSAKIQSDLWNYCIFMHLASRIDGIKLREHNLHMKNNFFKTSKKKILPVKRKILEVLSFFSKYNRVAVAGSYLGPWDQIKFNLSLLQFPSKLNFPEVPIFEKDPKMRDWGLAINSSCSSFERVLREFIPSQIPKVFLEGFSKSRKVALSKWHPQEPKIIFSTNPHFKDDLFKFWLIEKKKKGALLFTGQHGGGPFNKFNACTSYELLITDLHITTGKGNSANARLAPVGRFNNKIKVGKWKPDGLGLMTNVAMQRYLTDLRSMARPCHMPAYFNDLFMFYECLPDKIRKEFLVRIYGKEDFDWKQVERWRSKFPDVLLDMGSTPYFKQVRKTRINICTYDATTYNETLAANIPTIMFWNPEVWQQADYAKKYFDLLGQAGIFYTCPIKAAKHVEAVWANVSDWWKSPRVQEARVAYCEQYAQLDCKTTSALISVFKEELRKVRKQEKEML